jgi:hypothetical protein
MLTAFDDYPIHPSADPIAHPATGDRNHYDRYWFNGIAKDGSFYLGGAMGHYPVLGVIDAAFAVVHEGVEHSVFASGRMPLDRSTEVGPLRIEVLEPMRTLRFVADPKAEGIGCDLTFRATTIAIEEPRQRVVAPDGISATDHTRMTQWGTWEGTVWYDDVEISVDPEQTVATRDRSWGTRPVGTPLPTNRLQDMPQVFWLWAPIHFDDLCTHLALHEHTDGERWLETAMIVPRLATTDDPTCGVDTTTHLRDLSYQLEWVPGRRETRRSAFSMRDPVSGESYLLELETLFTYRMRGTGYSIHPDWMHGSIHGELETGRESIRLEEFDPAELSSTHIQSIVKATMGKRTGIGVLEQFPLGPHEPSGLTGFLDGFEVRRKG